MNYHTTARVTHVWSRVVWIQGCRMCQMWHSLIEIWNKLYKPPVSKGCEFFSIPSSLQSQSWVQVYRSSSFVFQSREHRHLYVCIPLSSHFICYNKPQKSLPFLVGFTHTDRWRSFFVEHDFPPPVNSEFATIPVKHRCLLHPHFRVDAELNVCSLRHHKSMVD
jgi:hypothetical protein